MIKDNCNKENEIKLKKNEDKFKNNEAELKNNEDKFDDEYDAFLIKLLGLGYVVNILFAVLASVACVIAWKRKGKKSK